MKYIALFSNSQFRKLKNQKELKALILGDEGALVVEIFEARKIDFEYIEDVKFKKAS